MNAQVYTPPFKPRAKQQEALDKMDGQEAFALFMAMRTGKTKVTLDDFGRLELAQKARNLMVIAPGGVYRTWQEQINDHFSEDLRQRTAVHVWESGPNQTQRKALERWRAISDRPRALLINIEALSVVEEARRLSLEFLASAPNVTAVDESTGIKTASAKRTKFINGKLAQHATIRRILCGLPTPKDPLDLYGQMEFLNWRILGFRSYFAFRARYAIMVQTEIGGRMIPLVRGFRDLDDLQRRIEPYSFRATLADCYDAPAKDYGFWDVELTAEQAKAYREMDQFATTQLSSGNFATSTVIVAKILKQHQILCGHVRDELGNFHDLAENRTRTIVDRLQEYDGKAVVWVAYDRDIYKMVDALKKAYGDESVARFWGGNQSTREAEEHRFKHDPTCRWMVATASAGGKGREWSVADLIIYHSATVNLDHQAQSEDRPQAVGKTRPVSYIFCRVPKTIEPKFIAAVRNKMDLSAAVLGEDPQAWFV
jgi:hypothetical protein